MHHRRTPKALVLTLLLVASTWLSACTAPSTNNLVKPTIGPDLNGLEAPGSAEEAWSLWIEEGSTTEAAAAFEKATQKPQQSPSENALIRYGLAETLIHAGHFTRGAEKHASILQDHPSQPLARWSAQRLWEMRDHVPSWDKIVQKTLEATSASPAPAYTKGHLGILALHAAYRAHRSSDANGTFSAEKIGFLNSWQVSGPFSIFPHFDAETPFSEIESARAMAKSYVLNGNEHKTRTLLLDEPFADPTFHSTGIYYLESWVELDKPTQVLAQLHSDAHLKVWLGEKPLFERNALQGYPGARQNTVITLNPGVHRVRVKIAVQEGNEKFLLLFSPLQGTVPWRQITPTQKSPLATFTTNTAKEPFAPIADPDSPHAFELWLGARSLLDEEDFPQALAYVERLLEVAPHFPAAHFLKANILRSAPHLPAQNREDAAISSYRKTLELDPAVFFAADRLAFHLSSQEKAEEALDILEALRDERPQEYLIHYHLYQIYRDKGWSVEARASLQKALELHPSNCTLVEERWNQWSERDTWPELASLPAPFMHCESTLENLALHYDLPQGKIQNAIQTFEHLTSRNPRSVRYLQTLARLYAQQDNLDQSRATFRKAAETALDPVAVYLQEFDAIHRKDPKAAQKWLQQKNKEIEGSYDLLRALRLAENRNVLDDLRVDGKTIIETYLQDPKETQSSAVFLLDYAAARVFEDGSQIMLTHIITRVQNKEGIDAFGEVEVPDGALLLSIRTVKPDGRTLEPEFLPEKPTISMPNLEPGDFVEYEYLEGASHNQIRKSSYHGTRFFFLLPDAPLLHSEYVVEVPEHWKPTIDHRNSAPTPDITTHNGRTRYRFLALDKSQHIEEPNALLNTEVYPSIRLHHAYTWADAHRTYRDRLLSNTIPDPRIRQLVEEATRNATTEEARTKAIFYHVLDQVSDDTSGPFVQPAAHVANAGLGDRLIVLKTMLDVAGIPNEMVLARTWGNDQTSTSAPEIDQWSFPLVRAWPDGKEVWLDPTLNHSIYGYISPSLQGNKALRLGKVDVLDFANNDTNGLFVDIPVLPPESDIRDVSLALHVNAEGNLSGKAEERYTGSGATLLRRIVDSYTDMDELRQALEQSMELSFPSVEIQNLTFENREDPEKPLWMKYDFTSRGFARAGDGTLEVDRKIFASELVTTYATLAKRKSTLDILEPVKIDLLVRLTLPEGFRFTLGPAPLNTEGSFGTIKRKEQDTGERHSIAYKQEFHLPIQRVEPQKYPDFLQFSHTVDEGERLILRAKK